MKKVKVVLIVIIVIAAIGLTLHLTDPFGIRDKDFIGFLKTIHGE